MPIGAVVVNLIKEPKIDAVLARAIVRDLERRGFKSEPMLKSVGISRRQIDDENGRVSIAKNDILFEQAAKATGDDLFGLKLGQTIDIREFGLIAYLGLSSPTLWDAIQNMVRYVRVYSDQTSLSTSNRLGGLMFEGQVRGVSDLKAKHANEAGLISLLRAYRLFASRKIIPVEVHFRHARKNNLKYLSSAFNCPVYFSSDTTGLIFKHDDLEIPLSSADDKLFKVLKGYCDEILAKRQRNEPPFLAETSAAIIDLLPKGQANAKVVATKLGMSNRTFLRRLKDMDTTFQKLVDDIRLDLAETYLRDPHLDTKQIAFLLGYSSSSAFSHGFRRLSGKSPGDVRGHPL